MKWIITTTKPYSDKFDEELKKLFLTKPEWVYILGKDCAAWEEAIDWIGIELNHFVVTTQHEGEELQDVIGYAQLLSESSEIKHLEI
jgi:hypothetical protein